MTELVNPENVAVLGGAWALRKVLGPSLTAMGGAFGGFTEFRLRNIRSIDQKVERRLGGQEVEDDPAIDGVHPRVAQTVLETGSWVDDDLHQEYLAGLLLDARSRDAASDAQAFLARIVGNLTAEQIRCHYAIYRAYAGYFDPQTGAKINWYDKNTYRDHAVVVPTAELEQTLPSYPWVGLLHEGLLSDYGQAPGSDRSIGFVPSWMGAQIMLHALGGPMTVNPEALCASDEMRAQLPENSVSDIDFTFPEPDPGTFPTFSIQPV